MNETIKQSKCCEAEVTYRARGWSTGKGVSVPYLCNKCERPCDITEVCIYCFGTGEVVTDEEDGEGHTMRGVGRKKCICKIIEKSNGED